MPIGEHYNDMEENTLKVIFKIRPHSSCERCKGKRNQCTGHSTSHSELLLQESTGHCGHGRLHPGALNQQANTAPEVMEDTQRTSASKACHRQRIKEG